MRLIILSAMATFIASWAHAAEPTPMTAGRYQLLFTGAINAGVSEVYRIDTSTGERWFLAQGAHWVQVKPMKPGHYQVVETGLIRDSQPEILMIHAETGETWRRVGMDWVPLK